LEFFYSINQDPWSVLPYYIYIWPVFSFVFITVVAKKLSIGYLTGIFCALIVTFSYPSIFTFHTGNFEGLVACFLLIATYAAVTNNWNFFGLAIGAAASMKGLPIGFLLLPLVTSTVRNFLSATKATFLAIVILTITPLVFLKNGFLDGGFLAVNNSLNSLRESFDNYQELMVNSASGINYGHSFLNSIHAIFGMEVMPSQTWGNIVLLTFIFVGLLTSIVLRKFQAPIWLVLSVIGAVGCLAPATSTDYKLLYFAPSIFAFVLSGESRIISLIPMSIVIIAMSSKPWFNVGSNAWANATVYLTTLLMLLLIPVSIFCAKVWSKASKAPEPIKGSTFSVPIPG
jgi:hypothetical protein